MLHSSYNLVKQREIIAELPGYYSKTPVNSDVHLFLTKYAIVNKSVNDFLKCGFKRRERAITLIDVNHISVVYIAFYSILTYLQHIKRFKRCFYYDIKQGQNGEQFQFSEQNMVFTGLFTGKKKARSPPGQTCLTYYSTCYEIGQNDKISKL